MIPVNIERDLKSALQKSAAALSAGYNLVIFPEGVRSRDGRMNRFKKTFAILARELEAAIVPVSIQGAYRALPYGSFRPRRHPVSLTFLDPVYPGDESFEELTRRVEDKIRREVETDD
jgi:long-chain acyl-CoA synthetase